MIPIAEKRGCSVYDLLNENCPATSSDLLVVPHFGGTGTPELDPFALGTITGFSMSTGLPEIYRAILEGLCFELRYNRDQLELCDISFSTLRATGGGAKSDVWLHLKADILGVPVAPLKSADAGSAGGAMLAAVTLSEFKNLKEAAEAFVKVRDPFLPDPQNKQYYTDKYEKYKKIRRNMLGEHKEFLHQANLRAIALSDYTTSMNNAREIGKTEGREEGRAESERKAYDDKIGVAKSLLGILDAETIAKKFKITIDEIITEKD
jgi:ribulose kinase